MSDDPAAFLARLVAILDAASVPYMVVGGLAAIAHGRPRTTQDVDIVVVLGGRDARRLATSFPADEWYADEDAAVDAVRHQRQFNVIDMATGWKADLIIRAGDPFHLEEFSRRRRATFAGVEAWVASPEDTVLSKLDWSRRSGGSERQIDDVRGILAVQGPTLDRVYVERWVDALGLRADWERVKGSGA